MLRSNAYAARSRTEAREKVRAFIMAVASQPAFPMRASARIQGA
jgi:hypothetical protein